MVDVFTHRATVSARETDFQRVSGWGRSPLLSLMGPSPRLLADPCLSLQREGIPDGECSEDTDCRAGESVVAGHGEGLAWLGLEQGKEIWTGRSMSLPLSLPCRAENRSLSTGGELYPGYL